MTNYVESIVSDIKREFAVSPTNSDVRPSIIHLIDWAVWDDDLSLSEMVDQLEAIQMSGCSGPSGFIYNNEIAKSVVELWDDMNDALTDYLDEMGEPFAVESVGQFVWFALEWYAQKLASFLRGLPEMDDPTTESIHKRFNDEVKPMVIDQYGEDDEPAMNEAFNNWTDILCKDGEMSDNMYNNIECPE